MLKKYWVNLIVLIFFVILTSLFFRKYVFQDLVPHPANLLVSFYSPWKYQEWEGYPNGPANKPIGFDVLKLFYSYRNYTTERLKTGEIPLWNPYVFSGNVHLATYQSAVFYPLNIVYFVLPLIDAWSLLVIVQPILAGYFTYLFLRLLKLGVRSSVFGGAVFAFSGWMIAWSEESLVIEHSALWLPLVIYGIELLFQKKYTSGFIITFLSFTFSILAGFLQMTLYLGFFSLGWVLFRYFGTHIKDKRAVIYFLYAGFASAFISAIQLAPAVESFFYSPRGIVSVPFIFETYLMKPWHLITLVVPDFWGNPGSYNYFGHGGGFYHEKVIFVGIPALLLAVHSLFRSSSKDSVLAFFKWTSVITLLLGFFPFGWLLYYISIPVISAMVPSRIFFLTAFSLAILSSFGIEDLLRNKLNTSLIRKILLSLAVVLVCLWLFVLVIKVFDRVRELIDPKSRFAIVSSRNLFIPTGIFILCTILLTAFSRWKRNLSFYFYILFALNILSSSYFANKFLYFSERKFVFPELSVLSKVKEISQHDRVWGYGNAHIEKNMLSFYGIYSPEGYDALYSQRYGELLNAQETGGNYSNQISRTDATLEYASERDKILENPFRKRLIELLGVRYVIESKVGDEKEWLEIEERFPPENFSSAWEDETFRIWEYKDALPRAFLVHNYIVEKNPEAIVSGIFNPDVNLRDTLFLETDPHLPPCNEPDNSTADIIEYKPERVLIKTNSPCTSLLFLSDTYYKGWNVRVDSTKSQVLRANYAFRSVVLPKGEHKVEFTYEPLSFKIGLWMSGLSLLLIHPVYLLMKKFTLKTNM